MYEVLRRVSLRGTRFIVATALACALAAHAPVLVAQEEFEIEIRGDLIWISADGADLQQLLQQFAIANDFKLWISGNLPQQSVSLHSEGKSIKETLRRLLSDNSYALVYDDNAAISALYVLPAGESGPTDLTIAPSEDEIRQQVLLDALESGQVPDEIKASMMDQFGADPEILQQAVMPQRTLAIERLIEKLEQIGSPSQETMQQLRRKLELEIELQNE